MNKKKEKKMNKKMRKELIQRQEKIELLILTHMSRSLKFSNFEHKAISLAIARSKMNFGI